MRVVSVGDNFRRVDIGVVGAVEIELEGHSSREVELRVQRAGAVTGLNGRRSAELPDIRGTGEWAVKAFLDAVAFILDLWEGEVHFGHHTRHVKAFSVYL